MDIKAPPKKYEFVTKTRVDPDKIQTSIHLIRRGDMRYEFRTTVVPNLIAAEDIVVIGQRLKGSHTYSSNFFKEHVILEVWLRRIADTFRVQFED